MLLYFAGSGITLPAAVFAPARFLPKCLCVYREQGQGEHPPVGDDAGGGRCTDFLGLGFRPKVCHK